MSMQGRDDLGDRMKGHEAVETGRRLDGRLPIYARLDGRGFSRFTRGLQRPFDARMSEAMIVTAADLVEETGAKIAYTQSDEISLLWKADTDLSQVFFDGKIQKLASVLASYATVSFNAAIAASGDPEFMSFMAKRPHFDARVFQLPSEAEGANAFLWRENDASRNAIQMVAHDRYSHASLHQVSTGEIVDRLLADGISMDSYPAYFRYGTYLKRRLVQRSLTPSERQRIPEGRRPPLETLFQRGEIARFQMPRGIGFDQRLKVLFGDSLPEADVVSTKVAA